jgi:hypothetical protein
MDPRTFKQWTPATAELELLHECWLARVPPARIAARFGYFRTEVKPVHAAAQDGARHAPAGTCQAAPAAPSSALQRRRSAARAHLRRRELQYSGQSWRPRRPGRALIRPDGAIITLIKSIVKDLANIPPWICGKRGGQLSPVRRVGQMPAMVAAIDPPKTISTIRKSRIGSILKDARRQCAAPSRLPVDAP